MKSPVFWNVTPCNPMKFNRRFGETYRLYLHGRKISRAKNQSESMWQAELVLGLLFYPEDGGDMFHRNVG
jgi:hypothetical protein